MNLTAIAIAFVASLGYVRTPRPAIATAEWVAAHPGSLQRPDDETLRILLYWEFRESSFRTDAIGDGGLAHGVLQLHGPCGLRPLAEQIACWVAIVRDGERLCPGHALAATWGSCRYAAAADARVARALR